MPAVKQEHATSFIRKECYITFEASIAVHLVVWFLVETETGELEVLARRPRVPIHAKVQALPC